MASQVHSSRKEIFIELHEKKHENRMWPNSYHFALIDGKPNPTRHFYGAEFIDDHYILSTQSHISGREGESRGTVGDHRGIIGIAHSISEAEHRLYQKAKQCAESYVKDFGMTDLIDCTFFAVRKLPRGGK